MAAGRAGEGKVKNAQTVREAKTLLSRELEKWRMLTYDDIVSMVDAQPATSVINGPSGAEYQIEVLAIWDGARGGPRFRPG